MKLVKRLLAVTAASVALLAAVQAHAETYAFSYSGIGVSASGSFTTVGSLITSFTGTRNGTTILGLVPLDSDDNYLYDNQFSTTAPYFTTSGVLYDIGGANADAHINLYYDDADFSFHDLRLNADATAITDTVVAFTVSAVPEAGTLAYMALGFGALGIGMARRKRA